MGLWNWWSAHVLGENKNSPTIVRPDKDQRPINQTDPVPRATIRLFPTLPDCPRNDGRHRPNPEEMEEPRVDLAKGVNSSWANRAPDD